MTFQLWKREVFSHCPLRKFKVHWKFSVDTPRVTFQISYGELETYSTARMRCFEKIWLLWKRNQARGMTKHTFIRGDVQKAFRAQWKLKLWVMLQKLKRWGIGLIAPNCSLISWRKTINVHHSDDFQTKTKTSMIVFGFKLCRDPLCTKDSALRVQVHDNNGSGLFRLHGEDYRAWRGLGTHQQFWPPKTELRGANPQKFRLWGGGETNP